MGGRVMLLNSKGEVGLYCGYRLMSIELPSLGQSEVELMKEVIFGDLWEKGYYITSALKYGGDFLIYSDHPSRVHSSFIAVVLPWKQPSASLTSLARVAHKVKKNILLCSVQDQQPAYYTMEWAGLTSSF